MVLCYNTFGDFMDEVKNIEKSIIKKFRKEIWAKYIKAIQEYELIKDDDKIAVCISGGKDSFLLAKCMEEIRRHGKIHFDLEFIVMNPGYDQKNIGKIKENLNKLNINAHIFETPIFDVANNSKESPCYLCARMRRGYLYSYASELGCNKIALGHHLDDVIETLILNVIYNGHYSGMMPKLHSDNFEGMELIRPLYLVREKDIKSWVKYNNLEFIDCACSVTKKNNGKRKEIKGLIEKLDKVYKGASINLFTSMSNVNLNTVLGYKKENNKTSFLDNYDDVNK